MGGCHREGNSAWWLLQPVAASCRKALVNAGWAVVLLSCTNGPREHSFRLVGGPFMTF